MSSALRLVNGRAVSRVDTKWTSVRFECRRTSKTPRRGLAGFTCMPTTLTAVGHCSTVASSTSSQCHRGSRPLSTTRSAAANFLARVLNTDHWLQCSIVRMALGYARELAAVGWEVGCSPAKSRDMSVCLFPDTCRPASRRCALSSGSLSPLSRVLVHRRTAHRGEKMSGDARSGTIARPRKRIPLCSEFRGVACK